MYTICKDNICMNNISKPIDNISKFKEILCLLHQDSFKMRFRVMMYLAAVCKSKLIGIVSRTSKLLLKSFMRLDAELRACFDYKNCQRTEIRKYAPCFCMSNERKVVKKTNERLLSTYRNWPLNSFGSIPTIC